MPIDSESRNTVLDPAGWLRVSALNYGYKHVKLFANGFYGAVRPFMYTHAVIIGEIGDTTGYADRWCFFSEKAARAALDEWDGEGEPQGWFRHPDSGRRVSLRADEIDGRGKVVGAIGVLYVRH